jgi:hypothetical protein
MAKMGKLCLDVAPLHLYCIDIRVKFVSGFGRHSAAQMRLLMENEETRKAAKEVRDVCADGMAFS